MLSNKCFDITTTSPHTFKTMHAIFANLRTEWNKTRMFDRTYVRFGKRQALKLVLLVILSALSYHFISRHVVTAVEIKGSSMFPTLRAGDRHLINRLVFLTREPQRGDLVAIKDPNHDDYAVKRIIGLPSDTVQMKNYFAYVNHQRLTEDYLPEDVKRRGEGAFEPAIVVPKGRYFVLGDNRPVSEDSRSYGPITRENILGVIKP